MYFTPSIWTRIGYYTGAFLVSIGITLGMGNTSPCAIFLTTGIALLLDAILGV